MIPRVGRLLDVVGEIKGLTKTNRKFYVFVSGSHRSMTAAPTASPQTLTVARQRSKNQSTTKMSEMPSIGRSTAFSTMTIVTKPASGMPVVLVNYAITPS